MKCHIKTLLPLTSTFLDESLNEAEKQLLSEGPRAHSGNVCRSSGRCWDGPTAPAQVNQANLFKRIEHQNMNHPKHKVFSVKI